VCTSHCWLRQRTIAAIWHRMWRLGVPCVWNVMYVDVSTLLQLSLHCTARLLLASTSPGS
jgi:hypothetical protein